MSHKDDLFRIDLTGEELLERLHAYFGGGTPSRKVMMVDSISRPRQREAIAAAMPEEGDRGVKFGLGCLNKYLGNGIAMGDLTRDYSGHRSLTADCRPGANAHINASGKLSLTAEELIMGSHMWETVMRNKVSGGGFRRGELSMLQSPYVYPGRPRYPGIWRNSFGGGLRKNVLFLCLEESGFINHYRDAIESERKLFRGLHSVETYEGWPYSGSIPAQLFSPFFAKAVKEFSAGANHTYIKLRGWELIVGGKQVHKWYPIQVQLKRPAFLDYLDSTVSRLQRQGLSGVNIGDQLPMTLVYGMGDHHYALDYIRKKEPLEPWAEDAVEKLVHLQMYGRLPMVHANGNLLVGHANRWTMEGIRHEIQKRRNRLKEAINPTKREKRGY